MKSMKHLPVLFAALVTLAVGLAQLHMTAGDFFNSYPWLFSDSYDWLMQGRYFLELLSGKDLPALQVLRDPGFVLFTTADQVAGGGGIVVIAILTLANFLGAYFVIRSIREFTDDWRLSLAGAAIYLLHPLLAMLRLYVMADQLAIGLMSGSFYFMLRWLKSARSPDFFRSAGFAAVAMLTQKYGVLPFLVGLGVAAIRQGRAFWNTKTVETVILGGVLALGPELLFMLGLRHAVAHEGMPTQLGLLGISLKNVPFYANTWTYAFACLVPLGAFALSQARAWIREVSVQYAFATAVAFNGLAFFAQWQDARYCTYSYVSALTATLSAFALAQRASAAVPGRAPAFSMAAGLSVAVSLGVLGLQVSGTPRGVLGPTALEVISPIRRPWPTLLAQAPIDRFGLSQFCDDTGRHFCRRAPALPGASPYETYTWAYYRCLKTGQMKTCQRKADATASATPVETTGNGLTVVGELTAERVIVQKVVPGKANLSAISVLLATYDRKNHCTLRVVLREAGATSPVLDRRVPCDEIQDNAMRPFPVGPLADSEHKTFTLTLSSEESGPGNALTVYLGQEPLPDTELEVDGAKRAGETIAYQLQYEGG